jgi:hypothetical protein
VNSTHSLHNSSFTQLFLTKQYPTIQVVSRAEMRTLFSEKFFSLFFLNFLFTYQVVSPPEMRALYSEKLLLLPFTYQVRFRNFPPPPFFCVIFFPRNPGALLGETSPSPFHLPGTFSQLSPPLFFCIIFLPRKCRRYIRRNFFSSPFFFLGQFAQFCIFIFMYLNIYVPTR